MQLVFVANDEIAQKIGQDLQLYTGENILIEEINLILDNFVINDINNREDNNGDGRVPVEKVECENEGN